MDFVFYDIRSYISLLEEELTGYMQTYGRECTFHHIRGQMLKCLPDDREYIIFYQFSDREGYEQIRRLTATNRHMIKRVALCMDNDEGIRALGKSNDYALKIPIEREKVLRCIKYLTGGKKK